MKAVAATPDQCAEQCEQHQGLASGACSVAKRHRRRHDEGRLQSEKDPADESGGAGRQRHRQERARAQFGQHQLDGEHHAADRRVEGGGDAGAGAGRDQT